MDVAIVGAGMAGLVAAAYLQRAGFDARVFEAQEHVGGCASAFTAEGYRFQAGATTLIGLDAGMPLRTVLDELGIAFDVSPLGSNLTVHGRRFGSFTLSSRDDESSREVARALGAGAENLFSSARSTGRAAWALLRSSALPPRSAADWLRAAVSPKAWAQLPNLLRSTRNVAYANGAGDALDVIDALLLVSTQGDSRAVPWLFGALGLEYLQRPLFLPEGGASALPEKIAETFVARGGILATRTPVTRIASEGSGFVLSTQGSDALKARAVVLNLTQWDAARLLDLKLAGEPRRQIERHRSAWGAMALYLGVDDPGVALSAPYQQLMLDAPLSCGATSLFVSFSSAGDRRCSPDGRRAVSVSCHTDAAALGSLDAAAHSAFKKRFEGEAMEALSKAMPAWFGKPPRFMRSATPRTFQAFTGRHLGFVGGLPLTAATLLKGYPTGRTTHPLLFRVGDTISPGQSLLATAWGARAAASELSTRLRSRTASLARANR